MSLGRPILPGPDEGRRITKSAGVSIFVVLCDRDLLGEVLACNDDGRGTAIRPRVLVNPDFYFAGAGCRLRGELRPRSAAGHAPLAMGLRRHGDFDSASSVG